eukprot:791619-Prymnesium_polylepis.1
MAVGGRVPVRGAVCRCAGCDGGHGHGSLPCCPSQHHATPRSGRSGRVAPDGQALQNLGGNEK